MWWSDAKFPKAGSRVCICMYAMSTVVALKKSFAARSRPGKGLSSNERTIPIPTFLLGSLLRNTILLLCKPSIFLFGRMLALPSSQSFHLESGLRSSGDLGRPILAFLLHFKMERWLWNDIIPIVKADCIISAHGEGKNKKAILHHRCGIVL